MGMLLNDADLIDRIFNHIDGKTTDAGTQVWREPAENYTSAERFAAELEVLRRIPVPFCPSAALAGPGDYIARIAAGTPLIVVRGDDGVVRAFRNACRHRGTAVAKEGEGCKRSFACPYHAWTYGLDGALESVPDRRNCDGVCKAGNGLAELPAAEKYGLVFVRPGGGAPIDVDRHLATLEQDVASYDFASFHHYRSLSIERQMNWKLCPETFMEGYHLEYLHRDSVGPIFFSNLMAFDGFGPHSRLTLPRQRIENLRRKPEADWRLVPETAIIYTFFPNVTLVVQAGHVEMWRSYPSGDAPDRCRVEVSVFTPEAVETEKARIYYEKNIDLAIRTVDGEDFPLSEGIQAGHAARAHEAVIYGRNEPALIHYHQNLTGALST